MGPINLPRIRALRPIKIVKKNSTNGKPKQQPLRALKSVQNEILKLYL